MAAALLYAAARIIGDGVHQWLSYGPLHPLLLVTTASLTLWSFALAGGCLLAALRLWQGKFPPPTGTRPRRPVLAYGFAFVALVAATTSLIGYAREVRVDPESCVASTDRGCIHGTVSDNGGKPLKGIEVEVLAADKTGEARWYSKKGEWTDTKGRFSVNQIEPGEYLVAVHYYGAPDVRQPFATAFYPGLEAEDAAARVLVVPNSQTMLKQLRLRSLPLATIKVEVVWPDGTRPKRSNLSFHNRSYPSQAVIGDEAPQIDDGVGEFALPEGFSYFARASVQCDSGRVIETRESRPVQEIEVGAGATPRRLTFTLPGPPCELWSPN
jgi:hypothetical protein